MEEDVSFFKDLDAFKEKDGVCYIPETSDKHYTYYDFFDIAEGDERTARLLFDHVTWQHPETLYEEWKDNDIV